MRWPVFGGVRAAFAAAAAVVLVLSSCAPAAVAPTPGDAAAPVVEGLGHHRMPADTDVARAQRHFDQALAHLYAFNQRDAVRSFKAAAQADPRCALCAWGVALALGPNINNARRGDLSEARDFARRARDLLRGGAAAKHAALIDALAVRYPEDDASASADVRQAPPSAMCTSASADRPPHAADAAYAQAMAQVARRHPDDPDIAALYAEALLLLSPWQWWDKAGGAPRGQVGEAVATLEAALVRHPNHAGLNHLLIHALEQSREPQRALAAAERLPRIAPGAAHLVHMPSHIYVRVGRYDDAVRANQAALDADARMRESIRAQSMDVLTNWDVHHLHFLWFAAAMDGRSGVALDAARQLAQRARGGSASEEYLRALPWLTLARFGRWREALDAQVGDDERSPFVVAVRRYARGMAYARTGQAGPSRSELAALQAIESGAAMATRKVFGQDNQQTLLRLAATSLRGEIALAERRHDDAIADLQRAVDMELKLDIDEPPGWGGATGPALAAALLLAGRPAQAQGAADADLVRHPGSAWALQVLAESQQRQGLAAQAQRSREAYRRAWARADVSAPDARF